MLGVLVFAAYAFLPFVNGPEMGALTPSELTSFRANNELDVTTNGLALIPFAALLAASVGLWTLRNPEVSRATAIFTVLAGVLVLEYYAVFALDYVREGGAYIGQMGLGFWVLLALGVLMVVQGALPRSVGASEYSLRSLLANQESAILIALVILIVAVGLTNPRFLATRNLLDVLQGNAYIAVAAIGMTFVIVTGNIDISVGSLVGLLAVVSGRLAVADAPIWLAWLLPLVLGAGVGAVIGLLVTYLRIPSIVVTLGMLSILKGVLILWTSGQRVTGMPPEYYLAQMRPFGLPMPILFMIVLTVLAALWMRYSVTGRTFYAVGGNAQAARLSGILANRVVMQAFILNGVFVGIASILYATQLRVIQATTPPALELFVITAAVVGGVSILGGTGTVIGAALAAVLLNAIRSGMIFINFPVFYLQAITGLLILVTVLIDLLRRRRQVG